MKTQTLGLLIGGVFPALLFGFSNIFQKASTRAGIGIGPFLIGIGLAVAAVGLVFLVASGDGHFSFRSISYASLLGIFWGSGMGAIAIALSKYEISLSQLVPLYNMNTLISVALALIIFSEWMRVNPFKLAMASLMIVLGGILASKA